MLDPKKNPQCVETGFQLPDFWDRSVTFFANLKSIFFGNDEQTKELAQEVGEIDSYGGRLAPVINLIYPGGDNTLLLEHPPDSALLGYFRNELNLSLPRIVQLSHEDYSNLTPNKNELRKLLGRDLEWVDGYVTDPRLCEWAQMGGGQTVSTPEGSRHGNNKRMLHQFLAEQGLPLPDTHIAADTADVGKALKSLEQLGYRNAVIRAALGASGVGMQKVSIENSHKKEPIPLPKMLFHDGPCLVQGWIEPGVNGVTSVTSPSVQLFLDDSQVHLYDITDQILSAHSVHEGNHSPPLEMAADLQRELINQAKVAGRWLHDQGYRGTASADFLVVEREGKTIDVHVCEINARITGATYPSVLGRHLLPNGAWMMQNLRLEEPLEGQKLLDLIRNSQWLFEKNASRGVVPINFNFDKHGKTRKCQFLCLDSNVESCREIMTAMVKSLPFKTRIERD